MKKGILHGKYREQRGALMVEAAFVFPIVLFILFLIIYLGDIYYQMARVNEVVNRYAVKGAQYVSDPLLQKVEKGSLGVNTDSSELKLQPYRYVAGVLGAGYIDNIVGTLNTNIKKELESDKYSVFDSVQIRNISTDNGGEKFCKYESGFFSSSFIVQVNYEIVFPFQWFGGTQMRVVKASARSECAVNDMDEFIRNVDMIVDLLEGTGFADKVSGWFEKMNSFIKKFSEWGS